MSSSRIRILYVDSDGAGTPAFTRSLDAATTGFDVESAASADEASDRLERAEYDAVVCRDVSESSPGSESDGELRDRKSSPGVEFLASVAADRPALTTVLLGDDISADGLRAAYAAGIDEVVPTPEDAADVRTLTERLSNHLPTSMLSTTDGSGEATDPSTDVESRSAEQASQLDSIAETTSDAIVIIDPDSVIRFANPALADVLGYDPDALVGESLTRLMNDDLADRHRAAFRRYLETGERRLDWDNVELPALHSDGHDVPVSVSFSEFVRDGERRFTGIIRDVTEAKELQAERELLHDVTREIAHAADFDEGVAVALQEVGAAMNWMYGEVWVPDEETDRLALHDERYVASPEYEAFYDDSRATTFERGEGLPGRVWATADPEWMADVTAESGPTFHRTEAARTAGFQAALGVPIATDGEVIAVLVFAMAQHRGPDDAMIEATTGVASSVGRLIRRKRAEQELREERNLKTRILETSPIGIVIIDAEGRFEYVNDAAESILGLSAGERGYPTYDEMAWQTLGAGGEPLDEPKRPYRHVLETGERLQREVQIRRSDGERRWLSVNGAPLESGAEEVTKTVFVFEDITGRKERERELERANAMLETVRDGVYALDDEGRFIATNRAYAEMVGRSREELLGEHATVVTSERIDADVEAIQAKLAETGKDAITYETTLETAGGTPLPIEARISLFPLGEDRCGRAGVIRDVSARKRHEQQLRLLNELSQALAGAEAVREACDIAVETARETLDLPLTAVELYDEETGRLEPVATTDAVTDLVEDGRLFGGGRDLPWTVYVEHEGRSSNDVAADESMADVETPLESAIVLPIGSHGVFVSGATEPNAFGVQERTLADIFVANVEAALDRVEREEKLRTRTETLERRTETLDRVNRINSVIREITGVLVQASSREEIEQTVCTRLASADPYRFVWIGEPNTIGGEVVPRASAGVERGYLDAITVTADDSETGMGPAGRAVQTHEPQVQNNIHSDASFAPWRSEALQRGYRASISVPLAYKETLYGVLNLYADAAGVFDEMEVTVLTELGEMIGYAINSLERKKALVSDTAVELRFTLADPSVAAVEFTRETGSRFEFDALVEQADGSLRAFFVVEGSPPEVVEEYAHKSLAVTDLNLIAERDDGYFYEATVSDKSFLSILLEAGAHPTKLVSTAEEAELTVELPETGDIKAFLEMFLRRYDAELAARRELDRPVKTEEEFQAVYKERLTDREEEVLRTAYYAGFFNFPRDSSGSEVADILGVSQPTVSRHLRKGERKLFDVVFEGDSGAAPPEPSE